MWHEIRNNIFQWLRCLETKKQSISNKSTTRCKYLRTQWEPGVQSRGVPGHWWHRISQQPWGPEFSQSSHRSCLCHHQCFQALPGPAGMWHSLSRPCLEKELFKRLLSGNPLPWNPCIKQHTDEYSPCQHRLSISIDPTMNSSWKHTLSILLYVKWIVSPWQLLKHWQCYSYVIPGTVNRKLGYMNLSKLKMGGNLHAKEGTPVRLQILSDKTRRGVVLRNVH